MADAYRTSAAESEDPPQRKSVPVPKLGQRVLLDGGHRLTGIVSFADETIVGINLDEGGFLRVRPEHLLILTWPHYWWIHLSKALQR